MQLVTGATGHLGNVLVRELLARGESVRAFVLPDADQSALDGLEIERFAGNVLDPDSITQAMQGCEIVYHLAGIVSTVPGKEDLMQQVNVTGVRNMAQAARHAQIRMIHTGSVHAFERLPHGMTIDETAPLVTPEQALSAYDATKAAGIRAVQQIIQDGLDAVIVCPAGVIGPHDYLGSEMGQAIMNFVRQRMPFIVNGGYNFVDVRDVVQGILLAAEKGETGELYMLSGHDISIGYIIELIQAITGDTKRAIAIPFGVAMVAARIAELMHKLFGITPLFTRYALHTLRDNADLSHAKADQQLGYTVRPTRDSLADIIAWHQARVTSPN